MKLPTLTNRSKRRAHSSFGMILAFGAFLILSITSCTKKDVSGAQSLQPIPVDAVGVRLGDASLNGNWVGTLDGFVNAQIQPQVSGYLIQQTYREGSQVSQGRVLFEIDPRPFQAAVDQAEAQVKQAKGQLAQAKAQQDLSQINLKRDAPLAEVRAISQSQLDNEKQQAEQADAVVASAEAAVSAAEAALTTAKLNLGFTQVRSLVSGVAGRANTQVGNLVGPQSLLTSVSQLDPIKVYFSISDSDYLALIARAHNMNGGLLAGSSAIPLKLTLADGSVWPQKGHIAFVDREMNQQTGAIRITALFPNPDNTLRPGQFGRVTAETDIRKNAVLVPQMAVQEVQGIQQVYVAGPDNRAHIINVTLGPQIGKDWIITSGLSAGQRVITSNMQKLQDGMKVNPHEVSEQAAIETTSPTGTR